MQFCFRVIKEEIPEAKVTSIDCDLIDFDSVRKAAESIKAQFSSRIDVLSNNAVLMADEDRAKDGVQAYILRTHKECRHYDVTL